MRLWLGILLLAAAPLVAPGQAQKKALSSFDAVSIKPAKNTEGGWGMHFTPTGFTAQGVRLTALIEEAYGFDWGSYRVEGVPAALDRQQFDIEARVDAEDEAAYSALSPEGRMLLLQRLLKDRFKLSAVREQRGRNVYLLEVAKGGARMGDPIVETQAQKAEPDRVKHMRLGSMEVERFSMEALARMLTDEVGRPLIDRTGLEEDIASR